MGTDGSVPAPAAVSAEEDQEPEQLGEGYGQGGHVGQSGSPERLPRPLHLLVIEKVAGFYGGQGPAAGIELRGEGHQLEQSRQAWSRCW